MSTPYYQDDRVTLHHGDCLDVLRTLPDASADSVVTDPPYGLEFMGKGWDAPWQESDVNADAGFHGGGISQTRGLPSFTGTSNPKCLDCKGTRRGRRDGTAKVAVCLCADGGRFPNVRAVEMRAFGDWCEAWATECLRVLKPGGHLLAFGGTRTWHRLACAVEDAGFEMRDSIAWIYGSGFPKSLNVSKALLDRRCQCPTVELGHGEPATERGVRALSDADVPQAVRVDGGPGSLLLPSVPEPGTPTAGRSELPAAEDGRSEPGMEGRRDLRATEGQLHRPALREVSTGVPADGPDGRLHHGAPPRDGAEAAAVSAAVGSGEPHQPRPAGQPAGEPGALPVERGSQAWGGWPLCGRCGKPSIPDGLGTAAKPAFEPVVVARKPLAGTVAANVLAHGTGALNIDGCRNALRDDEDADALTARSGGVRGFAGQYVGGTAKGAPPTDLSKGRWPANVALDPECATLLDEQSGTLTSGANPARRGADGDRQAYGEFGGQDDANPQRGSDSGGASRFFYVAKAPANERPRVNGTAHPTVKPLDLMRWLVRLVTPPGGTVLEPFAGSGTTVEACIVEGFRCIAIEKGEEYLPLITQRIHRQRNPVEAIRQTGADLGLFELDGEGA